MGKFKKWTTCFALMTGCEPNVNVIDFIATDIPKSKQFFNKIRTKKKNDGQVFILYFLCRKRLYNITILYDRFIQRSEIFLSDAHTKTPHIPAVLKTSFPAGRDYEPFIKNVI